MAEGGAGLGLADYLVLASVLLVSTMIGLYYRLTGGRQKTGQEYLLADGRCREGDNQIFITNIDFKFYYDRASVLPVAFSLMASFMSAITLLGVTMENYYYGTQFVMINFAYLLRYCIAFCTALHTVLQHSGGGLRVPSGVLQAPVRKCLPLLRAGLANPSVLQAMCYRSQQF